MTSSPVEAFLEQGEIEVLGAPVAEPLPPVVGVVSTGRVLDACLVAG
jgi:hypothetical protein